MRAALISNLAGREWNSNLESSIALIDGLRGCRFD